MNDIVTIDIEKTLALPDNSVTDAETIRQIGLATTGYARISREDSHKLCRKVKGGHEVYGLYPHIMKVYKIKPEINPDLCG